MNELNFELSKSRVYVLVDDQNRITRCEGGYTLSNCQIDVDTGEVDEYGNSITKKEIGESWLLIDEGEGDRYNLCQSHYFDGGLYTFDGICRYKLVDGAPVLRTEEELEGDRAARLKPETEPPEGDLAIWDELDRAYREGVDSI